MSKKNYKKSRKYKKMRRRKIIFGIEITVLLILSGILFVYAWINRSMDKMNQDTLDSSQIQINSEVKANTDLSQMSGTQVIALVGVDARGVEGAELAESMNSDTIILCCIDHDKQEIRMVSIMRDSWIIMAKYTDEYYEFDKANSAYNRGGPESMLSMLNTNLDLNISDYATVNFNALTTIIDDLGGLDMDMSYAEIVHMNNYCVETSKVTGMDYTPLEKKAGVHHLNGVQTVSYARIRYTSGNDFRRAARQREVIYKIIEKAKNSDIATLSKILDKVFPKVYTSFTKAEILQMGMSMMSYDIEDQTGFPFDHLYGERVKDAMGGLDVVLPVTLESNVIKLHEFLYPEDSYTPSDEVKAYSQRIVDKSGFGDESRLDHSEDGSLAAYRASGTK